jgi:hypothetical protein
VEALPSLRLAVSGPAVTLQGNSLLVSGGSISNQVFANVEKLDLRYRRIRDLSSSIKLT